MEEDIVNLKSEKTPELFNAGNYTAVAMAGDADDWRTYASLGLCGKTDDAIKGMERFDCPEARFYSAVASWIAGDEKKAIKGLSGINTAHARNILALISKPKIRVLSQFSFVRQPPHELVTAAGLDQKFEIRNIGFHPLDLPNKAYSDVRDFYDIKNPPDFYFCQMVEWHFLPHNLQQLPCPILAQTSDYDAYIHVIYPWLQLFDELVVTDGTEWEDVHRLVSVPVSTFPKTFGITDRVFSTPQSERNIDVFISGSIFHPFLPEKAILLQQILKIPDIKIKVINGFVSIEEYLALSGSSKVSFTFYRRPGGTVTRALDALGMGCAVAVQKGSVLNLFVGERNGILEYDFNARNLPSVVKKILGSWQQIKLSTAAGSEIIRRQFNLPAVASQYLRFLTFLAAKPRGQRQIFPQEELVQKRFTLSKGCLPCDPMEAQKMRRINILRWQKSWQENKNSRIIIDLTRDLVLDYATKLIKYKNKTDKDSKDIFNMTCGLYRAGIACFSKSLVLRFNFIRTVLHFGGPQEVQSALCLAQEVLDKPESFWQVDAMEDVFPWDFNSECFNYRQYLECVTGSLINGTKNNPQLVRLMLASINYYASFYRGSIDCLKRAVGLDSEFPFYKLRYAHCLIGEKNADYDKIYEILMQLAENSMLFLEAYKLLVMLADKIEAISCRKEEFTQILKKAGESIDFLEAVDTQNRFHACDRMFAVEKLQKPRNIMPQHIRESKADKIISQIMLELSKRRENPVMEELRFKLTNILNHLKSKLSKIIK